MSEQIIIRNGGEAPEAVRGSDPQASALAAAHADAAEFTRNGGQAPDASGGAPSQPRGARDGEDGSGNPPLGGVVLAK